MPDYTKELLPSKTAEILDTAFNYKDAFWRYQPGNFVSNIIFDGMAQKILDFQCKPDDVWLTSYPRTGSHWTQEIAWLIGNDCDFEKARNVVQQLRAPMIEEFVYFCQYADYLKEHLPEMLDPVGYCEQLESPRFIKTHMPWELLPKSYNQVKPKIIVSMRNPKDVFTSYYSFMCSFHHMKGISMEKFADIFLGGDCPSGDCNEFFLGFWKHRNDPNILIVKYEDTKTDTRGSIKRIADFLGKKLTDEQIDQLIDFVSIENMRKNKGFNFDAALATRREGEDLSEHQFIRKGKVGSWKEEMSPEMIARFDTYLEILEKEGLTFD